MSEILVALQADLRRELAHLNKLHHPVHPTAPEVIAEAEARVAEIRAEIKAEKTAQRED